MVYNHHFIRTAERRSIGCVNLAAKLDKATDDIKFADSHQRLMDLIQSIRDELGSAFPRYNNDQLPDVRLLIRENPPLEEVQAQGQSPTLTQVRPHQS